MNQTNSVINEIQIRFLRRNHYCHVLGKLTTSSALKKKKKFNIYQSIVRPVLMYGSMCRTNPSKKR